MILIADSGSTKTDWVLAAEGQGLRTLRTQGINPFHQDGETIREILGSELLPQIGDEQADCIYFYGSGVRPEKAPVMVEILRSVFPQASEVEAHSDLLGAARALCGRNSGIACILGTGANSCLYEDGAVCKNVPPLGYILGDEGSGAVLGKRFLNHLYRGDLSGNIVSCFQQETGLSMADVIDRVYRQPMANRFLASMSVFISKHLSDDPQLAEIVRENLRAFLQNHVVRYGRADLPVSFVGSIAWVYREQLSEVLSEAGLQLGSVEQGPIAGLVRYHVAPSSR